MKTNAITVKAGLWGRGLRLLLGALILFIVVPVYFILPADVLIAFLLLFLGLVLLYILLDILIVNYLPDINPILGAVLANLPVLLMVLLGRNAVQLSALSFLAISLVLIGLRGDPGCELMSLPGLIFKRQTRLPCFFFSPIDWLEKKFSGRGNTR
jgi:hypothetical protein